MDQELIGSEARFGHYVEALSEVIGHADRVEPLEGYLAETAEVFVLGLC